MNENTDQNPNNPLGGNIPGGSNALGLAALDLTGANTTDTSNWAVESHSAVYEALANSQGDCAGQGTLVVPFNSGGSIMIQKMRNEQTCGTQMPTVQTLSPTLVDIVADWVDMGALNN